MEDEAGRLRVGRGAVGCGGEDGVPQGEVRREGLLVGSHDADAVLQEERVGLSPVLGRGVVDEDGAAGRFTQVVDELRGGEGRRRGRVEVGVP